MTRTLFRAPASQTLVEPACFESGIGIAASWVGLLVHASYYNGKTYIGFCDGGGNARVASYNHSTHAWVLSPVIVSGLGADSHCTPSVLVRSSDHKLVVAVSPHDVNIGATHMYVAISTNAEDVSAWGAATDIKTSLGGTSYTYANLFQLSGESGKIYLFYRDEQSAGATAALCFSTSTDGGATWAAQTTLYLNSGKQLYWAIGSDDTSRIDFIVADGYAANNDAASAYHFYYTGGGYKKSDGTAITAGLPLAPANLTKIYDQSNGETRFPSMILTNGGNPCAVWVANNAAGSGSNENYWYGTSLAGVWTVNQITDTGSPPDANFSEGGVSIDPTNISRVFVSKKTSGVWQMFKYETSNGGSTWTNTQLTSDTSPTASDANNLRPTAPRNAASGLTMVMLIGPHWAFSSAEPPAAQIRGYPNPIV